MGLHRQICRKFRVKGQETLPFTGWLDSNREHIAELFCEFGYKVGAEVGVRTGAYSEAILKKNPGIKLFCIDSWAPYSRTSQHRQNMNFYYAKKRLESYNVEFIRKPSMEALADIPDLSLDFVYIDALHDFDNVMMDLIGWSKKVKSGGIVSGHDYVHLHNCGVIPAVRAYVEGHTITQWFLTKDYAVQPSFFWVKP
jgi:hypothetical protein